MAAKKTDELEYLVKSSLHHDGEAFEPGEAVSLTVSQAKPLLDVGAVAEQPKAVAPASQNAA